MRIIISGSRNVEQGCFDQAISQCPWLLQADILLSGGARGVDRLAEDWAERHSIEVVRYMPDWKQYGRGAGIIRNRGMVDNADALFAIWDGHSRGTNQIIQYARKKHLLVGVYRVDLGQYIDNADHSALT